MGCVVAVVLLLSVVPGEAPVHRGLWIGWIESVELRWRRGERRFSTVRVRMVFRFSLVEEGVSGGSWGVGWRGGT